MQIGNKNFDLTNQILIMGILNVTPDSFSDGGKFNNLDASLNQVEKMIADGADIIDLGGESTRPGHTQISDAEEIERIVPMIEAIHQRFDIPISIDTYKGPVGAAENIDLPAHQFSRFLYIATAILIEIPFRATAPASANGRRMIPVKYHSDSR